MAEVPALTMAELLAWARAQVTADQPDTAVLDLIVAAYKFAGVPDPWVMAAKFIERQK